MNHPTACCAAPGSYCARTDRLVGLDGVHVIDVARTGRELVLTIETPARLEGCGVCGVVAVSHGRRPRVLHDIPCAGVPVRIRWRRRTWSCPDPGCGVGTFTETVATLAAPRARLTSRAIWWAIGQLRTAHATVAGLARALGVDWHTLWAAIRPRLEDLATDESRFAGVAALGVDEHVWHHTPAKAAAKGPTMLTGMVDPTRDTDGRVRARLLDPFRGHANALRDELGEATPVLDAFHVVKLAGQALDEVRRRVQQDTLGRRGHKSDPLYRIRNIARTGAEHLSDRQWGRLLDCLGRGDPDDEVLVAWPDSCRASHPATGGSLARICSAFWLS